MRRKRYAVLSVFMVIAVVVAYALGTRFIAPFLYYTATHQNIGANVTVTGSKVPRAMKATAVAIKPPVGSQFTLVGETIDVTPSGPLPAPVTLQFKLGSRAEPGEIFLVATSESAKGLLPLMQPTISSDGWYASVRTTHLSLFSVTNVDPSKLLDAMHKFFDGMTANLLANATPPHCDQDYYHDPTLAHEGYSTSWIGGAFYHQTTESSIYWCFGIENGRPAVKIVNKLSYPLDVSHSGFTMYAGNGLQFSLDQFARLAAGPDTILYPYQEADYYVTGTAAGSKLEISTDASALAAALGAFQTTVLAGLFLIAELAPTVKTTTQIGIEFTINGQDVWVFLSRTTFTLGDESFFLKFLNIVLGDIPACATAIYQFRDHPDPSGLVGTCLPAILDAITLVAVAGTAVAVVGIAIGAAAAVIAGVVAAVLVVLAVVSIISGIKSLVAVLHDATTNLMQYHVTVTTPAPTSSPPSHLPTQPPSVQPPLLAESIQIGWSGAYSSYIWMTLNGFPVGSYQYTCAFGSGGNQIFTLTETSEPQSWDNGHTCSDKISGDTVWVTIGSVSSNRIIVPTPQSPPPPQPVDAYNNYGTYNGSYPMCRGNVNYSPSQPGGTVSQTFTVPSGVAKLSGAEVQIDPDSRVTAHLSIVRNGTVVATTSSAAAGDTYFTYGPVSVSAGDTITLSITFTATYGSIITVYSAGSPGGTFSVSNSCASSSTNVTSTSVGLRAVVSGMS